jgi:hypothetical protein
MPFHLGSNTHAPLARPRHGPDLVLPGIRIDVCRDPAPRRRRLLMTMPKAVSPWPKYPSDGFPRATVQNISHPEFVSNSVAISVSEIARILLKNFADP